MEVTQDRKVKSLVIVPSDTTEEQVRDTLCRALQELGIEITDKPTIERSIESSNFIIVDTTGNDPDVMYELGFAHALRIPTLLIRSAVSEKMPFALDGCYYLVYDPTDLGDLSYHIKRAANRLITRIRGE